jgi:hypothetical protein
MSGNGQLIRSIRAGGGGAVAAAQELLRRAQSGNVTGAELREVQEIAKLPEFKDAFAEVAHELGALLANGNEPRPMARTSALKPDTSKFTNALELPARFLSDLKLVEPQLLQHAGLGTEEKAARAFEFFEPYAERFVELAHDPVKPLTPAEVQTGLARFEKALTKADFAAIRTSDGRTGVDVAKELLQGKTTGPRPKLDAPGWKEDERSLRAQVETERRVVQLESRPLVQPRAAAAKPEDGVAGRREKKGTDKVLGSQMLWNVLHLARGEELDDVARRDAMNALIVSAGLLLVLGGVLVGILVWM